MKKWLISFALSACLVFFIIPHQANGRTIPNSFPASCLSIRPQIISNDTVPKKVSLFKKLGDFLKFRKNMREAERKRILDVVNKTFLKDSIMANARDIQILNIALTDTVNQKFDSLVSLINAIKLSEEKTDSLLPKDTIGIIYDTVIHDSDINELLNKILPLLKRKIWENKDSLDELTMLKNIRYFYGRAKKPVDTFDNGTLRLRLIRKARIYSFFPSGMGGNYLDYNFGIINTLIYDGYELDGRTGYCKDMGGQATANALKSAREAGCKVLLTIKGMDPYNISIFLQNGNGQEKILISQALKLIRQQNADGINIKFSGLDNKYRWDFVTFIDALSDSLENKCQDCQLVITIPPGDKNSAYDINKLNTSNVKFLIDFSENYPGRSAEPLAPLKGGNGKGIESTISRYLNSNVPPSKFIVCLPYYGAQWKINSRDNNDQFIKYLSLDEIAYQFTEPTLYDPQTATTFINLMDDDKQLTGQIWYNDAKVLDNIYDFILQNGLGGLAVQPLETKVGYSDIWTGIGNKFLSIDTIESDYFRHIKHEERNYMDSIKSNESFDSSWHYFVHCDTLLKRIHFLFNHPCETEFPIGYASPVLNQSLNKDSTILLKNDSSILNQSLYTILSNYDTISLKTRMKSRVEFFRIWRVTKFLVLMIGLLFLISFIAVCYVYLNKLRKLGKKWKYKKITGTILIILAILVIFFAFMYLFLSSTIPGFGTNDGESECYNMPFGTLILIIVSGIVAGIIIMRYLIFPLIKKDNIP